MKYITLLLLFSLTGCVTPIPHADTLASPMEGKLTLDGKPVQGLQIVRQVNSQWYEGDNIHRTITDENGNFSFPSIVKVRPVNFLHQPAISQKYFTILDGEEIILWRRSKMDYRKYGEIGYSYEKKDYVNREAGIISIRNDKLFWKIELTETKNWDDKESLLRKKIKTQNKAAVETRLTPSRIL